MMCFGLKERERGKSFQNHCVIVFLDDTKIAHDLQASTTGQDLLDVAIKHLNLLETSYFGLRYFESDNTRQRQACWLDTQRSAIKQLRSVSPLTVYFGVKYYAADPCKLAEEITRYQFFLQLKRDILHARLPVPRDLAVELFALAVQSELGDFDPKSHHEHYVAEFQFVQNQTVELEQQVANWHRQLAGQVPASAELNFLERVKWLDLYGCELHPIQYEEGANESYALGLNPSGVLVLRNKLRVAHYQWPRIVKTKSQGRCLLMDVLEVVQQQASGKTTRQQKGQPHQRNRFGFRLADKLAAERLRESIEERKSFYQLIHSSAAQGQQPMSQQQQMRLGQRFRASIRSAIQVGRPLVGGQQLDCVAARPNQKLGASIRSLHQQRHYELDCQGRQPPTVVRMPSRRYSNRSLPRPQMQQHQANRSNQMVGGSSHTMVESQRQQALMMMSQLQHFDGRAHTLKPVASRHQADDKRNPYYQMMMLMMQQQHQQQQQQHHSLMVPDGFQGPEVSVLPPGRHIVQPSVYKAASVMNGINQLGEQPTSMQFFDSSRPQVAPVNFRSGYDSPKSTKSAIGAAGVIKMASKKLAKQQQQQRLYENELAIRSAEQATLAQHQDTRPLLAYDMNQQHEYQGIHQAANYYSSNSANVSPRSVRSTKTQTNARSKSKSINENLNLVHAKYQQQQQVVKRMANNNNSNNLPVGQSKMLLATAQMMQQQQQFTAPPPPGYFSSVGQVGGLARLGARQASAHQLVAENEDGRTLMAAGHRKRATFAMEQSADKARQTDRSARQNKDEDHYYCSRSDCSSIEADSPTTRLARPVARQQLQQVPAAEGQSAAKSQDQLEWEAIRRRHNDFLLNGSVGRRRNEPSMAAETEGQQTGQGSQLVKNMTNKQATPILLSMSYADRQPSEDGANNKAIQLLNLQRQQLNTSANQQELAKGSLASSSASSSVPSSPQTSASPAVANLEEASVAEEKQRQPQVGHHHVANSIASSSTTSGYYAGSNQSTGSASIDSDGQQSGEQPKVTRQSVVGLKDQLTGSRAKIALGSHGLASRAAIRHQDQEDKRPAAKQQFYLGESNNNNNELLSANSPQQDGNSLQSSIDGQTTGHWSPVSQQQQPQQLAPSSLKYVSFDV